MGMCMWYDSELLHLYTCTCIIRTYLYMYSDKGILMTFGSGINGCLGCGNKEDAPEVTIVNYMYIHFSKYEIYEG